MNVSEINLNIQALQGKLDILNGMENLNTEQFQLKNEIEDEIRNLERQLPQERLTVPQNTHLGGGNGSGGGYASASQGRLKAPGDKKDYKALFGRAGYHWQAKGQNDGFFNAVFSGRHDPRLINSGMSTTVPSDGGFLVPTETAQQIHNISLESELVMPRAFVQPMTSNTLEIPAIQIGNHSVNLFGGFEAHYVEEKGDLQEKNPKVRQMTLNAKKLTGLLRLSNELVADMVGSEEQIVRICGQGLSWYRDRSFLRGSGAGEPLGILSAPCTIEVDKLTGQANDTIHYENLTMMLSRLHAASFNRSVWICHQSTIPQLMQLFVVHEAGDDTLGSHYPVLREDGQGFKMLTRPVVFTEKTMPLGSRGDVILADLSQYVIGLRQGMRFDLSIHPHFKTDELAARLIERHDGQPLWDGPLTLEDGSTTVSPFVVLGERKGE